MNSFDAVVCVGLVFAVVTGFNTGLVRSAVTIVAYLFAAPIAMGVMSAVSPPASGNPTSVLAQNGFVFFGIFLLAGMAFGKLARTLVDEATGSQSGIVDRLCGAVLGAGRVGLIAVTVVLVVDQLLPPQLQPPWLTGSHLRPWLSAAGQQGVKSLPPDVAATLDRLKRNQQI
ncbi:CvpA family protein [Afipia sp. GAS231]|uniref:CvpA family protein n=1 Tax=Afipia sp. GAS231 TaxID=1882747 RepID=UPI00087C2C8C|nr:CvpA family protein [Afipia sp. GAS231]SDO63500.1 membrane protein required for colicin V production [Afipia sp. GAS231]